MNEEIILSVECDEPEGRITRDVFLAPLNEENLRLFWDNLQQFPTIFNQSVQNVQEFLEAFISRDGKALRANGIIWRVDDIGIFFLTDIFPGYQATGHITFWDRRLKGRKPLLRAMIKYVFKEFGFHRLIAEVPLYTMSTIYFTEGVGFVKEGRLREAVRYKGEWWDVNIYSILEREVLGNGIPETEGEQVRDEDTGDSVRGGLPGPVAEVAGGR